MARIVAIGEVMAELSLGAERTASSFVFEPMVEVLVGVDVPDEPASLLVAPEALVPAVPPDSSAHATPLCHPVRMATPTTMATTKPPTRPTDASLGMRYVYRLGSLGVPGMPETGSLPTVVASAGEPTDLSRA